MKRRNKVITVMFSVISLFKLPIRDAGTGRDTKGETSSFVFNFLISLW